MISPRGKLRNYTEPAIGWNDEDFQAGVTKFGIANYEGTCKATREGTSGAPLPHDAVS